MKRKSAIHKDSQNKKIKDINSLVCSICGLPGEVEYQEKDEQSGATKTKRHVVGCLGHTGIKAPYWNRHKDHDSYKKYIVQKRALNQD